MKQLLAWTGSADSTITSEAVMAMAEKFQYWTGGLFADPQRAWSYASHRGHLWVMTYRSGNVERAPARPRTAAEVVALR